MRDGLLYASASLGHGRAYIYAIIGHFRASFSRLYRHCLRGCLAIKTILRKCVILVLEWRQKKSRKG